MPSPDEVWRRIAADIDAQGAPLGATEVAALKPREQTLMRIAALTGYRCAQDDIALDLEARMARA